MNLNQEQLFQIMKSGECIEINFRMLIQPQHLSGHQKVENNWSASSHGEAKSFSKVDLLSSSDLKLKIQQLLQQKARSLFKQNEDCQNGAIKTEALSNLASNLNRISNHLSSDRQERERTRQNKRPSNPQEKPCSKLISSSLLSLLRQATKVSFQPKFNLSDTIYALYNNTFSIRSTKHPGFMIVNQHSCKISQVYEIKFQTIIENIPFVDECDAADCGIGITFNPQDLLKKNKKNPIDRCMVYYFGRQKISICGETDRIPISKDEDNSYRLLISLRSRTFVIVRERDMRIVVKRTIPDDFLQHSAYIFVELKNKGKIKLL